MSYQHRIEADGDFALGPLKIVWDHGRHLDQDSSPPRLGDQLREPAYVLPGGARVASREDAFAAAERINAHLVRNPCCVARGPLEVRQ